MLTFAPLVILALVGSVQSDFIHPHVRPFNENLEEFESEFGVVINDEDREETAKILAELEVQINANNARYEKGESSIKEKLWPLSVEPKKEFEAEMMGALELPEGDRSNGLIHPTKDQMNEPGNLAKVKAMYTMPEMNRQSYPDKVDYRDMGIVTKPKNQYNCGSCVAFAATGLHEFCISRTLKKHGSFTVHGVEYLIAKANLDLSEQYLVDCGYDGSTMLACKGAIPGSYTKWFVRNGGVGPSEWRYPYLDRYPNKNCDVAKDLPKWNTVKMTDSKTDYWCNADKMKKLVATKGAVMASVYASDWSFIEYWGGVHKDCSTKKTNHAVLVVGYGTTDEGEDYWIVKNSWGENWGDNGYIKIRRGQNDCGIETYCTVADCELNQHPAPQPTGTPPKPQPVPNPTYPTNLKCDMTSHYKGQKVTGDGLVIYYKADGERIRSIVNCKDSICTPHLPGPSNACVYICGKIKC